MTLDENELCMIEQLCYLTEDIAEVAGIDGFNGIKLKENEKFKTIEELLAPFDDTAISNLEALGNQEVGSACVSGKEWADIIRYIKGNEKLKSLVLTDTMENSKGTTLALCFTETADSSEAIVAFKGTSGGEEWIDNVEGLNVSDTQCQKEALDFIESLGYTDITVTGHSKGGNKAMYVAITSDRVKECVAFDAQGFSQKFLDKYWAEIQKRGGNISNYSLEADYVHALMFQIPNAHLIYCIGAGVDNIKQYHSPNSFFLQDNGGNLWLDESGNIIIRQGEEAESITMLHNFTAFIINNANEKDKGQMINYISQLLALTFGGDDVSKVELIDFALSDSDSLALVLAYLVKYMDVYSLDAEDIDGLLDTLGINSLDELITIKEYDLYASKMELKLMEEAGINGSEKIHVYHRLNLAYILNLIKKHLTDNDDDWLLKNILPVLKKCFFDDIDIDAKALWEKINQKIKTIDVSGGIEHHRTAVIHDFSQNVYSTLKEVVAKMENVSFDNVASWSDYAQEEWYFQLFVPTAAKGIASYFDRVSEVSAECRARMDAIFEEVMQIDNKYAEGIRADNDSLRITGKSLLERAMDFA